MKVQKQPPRGVPRERCSENMKQIYRRALMPKCNFNNFFSSKDNDEECIMHLKSDNIT